ncbi:uncharacterized protein RHOBADRAFT_46752 [Rhodotorula graminis WP1]|uniref:Uncharacterized protein n=1 Tax=Rhodotorula graminis (strain WP1) TaxID=578459 RepID=A0A0P9FAQ6_RHOGW|nr:uncharacterized protein RHOBADRAFT_46752 [Rhodotorula graminis WP1]KPV72706.1 hypothetical protein RHOBADRAFT_46752 [Rhodotorula graminis WP1]
MSIFRHFATDAKAPTSSSSQQIPPQQHLPPPEYPHPHPTSSYANPTRPVAPTYAALHLARSDRVRLIAFPPTVIQPVHDAITRSWALGIQHAGVSDPVSYEFKLRGNPWYGQAEQAVPSRRLVSNLLACLSSQGWHLASEVDLSRKGYDKDTLLFRSGPPLARQVFSVSFNQGDKARIIDPPNDEVLNAFLAAVSSWPAGIQSQALKEPGAWQIKLRGYPWHTSSGSEVNHARILACNILAALDGLGWELIGSVDISQGSDGQDLDSWFFGQKI